MNENKYINRRKFNRIMLNESVRYQFKDPAQFGGCVSCDVSDGGVRINVNSFIPLNTELTLEVQLPSKEIIEREGKVVWVEKFRFSDRYQAGIEFKETK